MAIGVALLTHFDKFRGCRDIACSHKYLQLLDRSCVGAAGFLIPPRGSACPMNLVALKPNPALAVLRA